MKGLGVNGSLPKSLFLKVKLLKIFSHFVRFSFYFFFRLKTEVKLIFPSIPMEASLVLTFWLGHQEYLDDP